MLKSWYLAKKPMYIFFCNKPQIFLAMNLTRVISWTWNIGTWYLHVYCVTHSRMTKNVTPQTYAAERVCHHTLTFHHRCVLYSVQCRGVTVPGPLRPGSVHLETEQRPSGGHFRETELCQQLGAKQVLSLGCGRRGWIFNAMASCKLDNSRFPIFCFGTDPHLMFIVHKINDTD